LYDLTQGFLFLRFLFFTHDCLLFFFSWRT